MNEVISDKAGRLDVVLARLAGLTRSQAEKLIAAGQVGIDGKKAFKAGQPVRPGQRLSYAEASEGEEGFVPRAIDFKTVYEDDDLMVINKPRGLVVHPAFGHRDDTLANGLAYKLEHEGKMPDDDSRFRMGIVHRIDKDTSGLLIVAKNPLARERLSAQLKGHRIRREYLCLAYGIIPDRFFKVDAPIGRNRLDRKKMGIDLRNGKEAVTHFEAVRQFESACLLRCRLETGRTHQIRVHLAFINHPIVGDAVYSSRRFPSADQGQLLHAYKLTFVHPTTGREMTFYAPVDDYFRKNAALFAKGSA